MPTVYEVVMTAGRDLDARTVPRSERDLVTAVLGGRYIPRDDVPIEWVAIRFLLVLEQTHPREAYLLSMVYGMTGHGALSYRKAGLRLLRCDGKGMGISGTMALSFSRRGLSLLRHPNRCRQYKDMIVDDTSARDPHFPR